MRSASGRATNVADPALRRSRCWAAALAAVVLFSALAFGAVHAWASAIAELGLWACWVGWKVGGDARPLPRGLAAAAIALWLYLGLQLLPLPPGWLAALSPTAAALRAQALETLSSTAGTLPEIGPVAGVEDRAAPVATRVKVRSMAEAEARWIPIGWAPLSLYPYATRGDLLVYLAVGVAFWMAATIGDPQLLLRCVATIGASLALLALVELATWNGYILWFFAPYDSGPLVDYPRMFSSFVNPDHFASFLIMSLPASVALLVEGRRPVRASGPSPSRLGPLGAILLAVGLALMGAALIGAASRAAIVGVMLGFAFFGWKVWRARARDGRSAGVPGRRARNRLERAQRLARRIAPFAITVTVVAGGMIYAGASARATLGERIASLLLAPEEIGFRVSMPAQSLPMLRDFPLFGVGAACWREVYRRYEVYPIVGLRPNHAHNDYVEWSTEVGLVGLLLTLGLAWHVARWARANQGIPPVLRWGLAGGVIAIAWQELLDFGLRAPANALLLAILLGLLCNRRWESSAGAPGEISRGWSQAASVAVALAWLSVGQLREFVEWSRVRAGATELRFAPRSAETWHELGALLSRGGFRYLPPTAECFRAAIRRRPTSEASFRMLARGARRHADQRRLLETALALDPTRAPWRLEYARLLEQGGETAAAVAQIEQAAYGDPRLESHAYLDPTNQRLNQTLLDAVERGFRHALADRPDDPALLDAVATFYVRFQRWDEAAELWSRAAIETGDWTTYGPRAADGYARSGSYDRAEEILRRSLDQDPADAESYRVLAMRVFAPRRRFEEAANTLALGARRSRDPVSLYLTLFQLETEKGDRVAALAALEKAADLRQRDAGLAARLGASYLQAEDYHRAEMAFDRAIAIEPDRAPYHYYRGLAAEGRYDLAKALGSYERAESLDPINQEYADRAERLRREMTSDGGSSR